MGHFTAKPPCLMATAGDSGHLARDCPSHCLKFHATDEESAK